MATSAAKTQACPRTTGFAAEAAVERSKLRALVGWFFAPPKLPIYPPTDYAREPIGQSLSNPHLSC